MRGGTRSRRLLSAAALELLKTLVLEGRLITGDAMFCQRDLCQQVRDDDGHRPLAVELGWAGRAPRRKRGVVD